MPPPKEASLPVRLDKPIKLRLQRIAEELGMTVSALIRMLVQSFIEEYDRNEGRVSLPLKWPQQPTENPPKNTTDHEPPA